MTTTGTERLQALADIPGIPDSVPIADPLRLCAAYMIDLMNARTDELIVSQSSDQTQRKTLEIECGAPFSRNLGLCLNDNAYDFSEQALGEISRIDMTMTIGEAVTEGRVHSRFIKLGRRDGKPFGVTGLSKEVCSSEYERWHAITMRMLSDGSDLLADLWGTAYADDAPVSALLVEQCAGGFGSYQVSMYKALGRTSRNQK